MIVWDLKIRTPMPSTCKAPIHLHFCGQLRVKIRAKKAKLSEGTTNQQPENTRPCFL